MFTITYTDRNLVPHSLVVVDDMAGAYATADRLVENGHVYDVDGEHLISVSLGSWD